LHLARVSSDRFWSTRQSLFKWHDGPSFLPSLTRCASRGRRHAKKKKGSKNRAKARKKVARLHARIADCRRDFLHKLSTKLIRENQTICVETLAVKNMVKNHKLAKAIHDVGWSLFVSQLDYKADWYGRTLVKIDRWYPSRKRCFGCGHMLDSLTLDVRHWTCPECGVVHDRDINAAKVRRFGA
jgi:putative transposase